MSNAHTHPDPKPSPADASDDTTVPAPEGSTEESALVTDVERLENEHGMLRDQLLRRAAEFENFKRRVDRERIEWMHVATERAVAAFLPVLDDLDRSLASVDAADRANPFYAGVELIRANVMKILESFGVVPFESVGNPFDVALHEALMQVDRPDLPPHVVVEEALRGYMIGDRVLRHARVVVSADPH